MDAQRQMVFPAPVLQQVGHVLRDACDLAGFPYGEAWYPTVNKRFGVVLECYPVFFLRGGDGNRLARFRRLSETIAFPADVGIAGRTAFRRRAEWITDTTKLSPTSHVRLEFANEVGLKSCISVPVRRAGLLLGVVLLWTFDVTRESADVLERVQQHVNAHFPLYPTEIERIPQMPQRGDSDGFDDDRQESDRDSYGGEDEAGDASSDGEMGGAALDGHELDPDVAGAFAAVPAAAAAAAATTSTAAAAAAAAAGASPITAPAAGAMAPTGATPASQSAKGRASSSRADRGSASASAKRQSGQTGRSEVDGGSARTAKRVAVASLLSPPGSGAGSVAQVFGTPPMSHPFVPMGSQSTPPLLQQPQLPSLTMSPQQQQQQQHLQQPPPALPPPPLPLMQLPPLTSAHLSPSSLLNPGAGYMPPGLPTARLGFPLPPPPGRPM